jgi:hypothetical protein
MRFRFRRSPRVAIVLVCGCALMSLCWFHRNVWRAYAMRGEDNLAEELVARYEPLRPLLPTAEMIGFVVDERHADTERMCPGGRLYLAQYALSPRRLAFSAALRWVIVDSDCPTIVPEIAASGHWTLQADLHNGARLYRTDARE